MNDIGDFNDDWLNNLLMPLFFITWFIQSLHKVEHMHACCIWVSCATYCMQTSLVCQFIGDEDGMEVVTSDYRKIMQNANF